MSTTPTSRALDEPLLAAPEPFVLEPPEPLPESTPGGAAGVCGVRGVGVGVGAGAGAGAALEGALDVASFRSADDTGMEIAAPSAAAPIASATLPQTLPR